ncbi:hypothetical protein ACTFSP_22540 [Bacillus cereus group sp. MYBK108-2]|uniref:hypothetical protein n=1 Tax=Bacillus cereus group TaxID=86661 RepID=UPI0015C671B4|nr:hypothetical protein [Bacillus cereus]
MTTLPPISPFTFPSGPTDVNRPTGNTGSTGPPAPPLVCDVAGSIGECSFEGSPVENGNCSFAEGCGTTANRDCSHAEGSQTVANGSTSHPEGVHTQPNGEASHAEGSLTIADGDFSHAEGENTTTAGFQNAHIMGRALAMQKNLIHGLLQMAQRIYLEV